MSEKTPARKTHFDQPNGTNVAFGLTGILAAIVTVVLYLVLSRFSLQKYYLVTLLTDRGWTMPAMTLLVSWAAWILLIKAWKVRGQERSLQLNLLFGGDTKEIHPEDADQYLARIRSLRDVGTHNFLVKRLTRALEHFKSRRNVSDVADMLESQAEIDATGVHSSYTLLHVFIWAIPILGFIGTVLGIAQSVGGFEQSLHTADELDAVKVGLGQVTGGLAVAFETTLVALVLSISLMFPTSALQKREEDLLNAISEFCNQKLLARLSDQHEHDSPLREEIQAAVIRAVAPLEAEFRQRQDQLKQFADGLTQQFMIGWQAIHDEVQKRHEERLHEAANVWKTVTERQQETSCRLSEIHGEIDGQLRRTVDEIAKTASVTQSQLLDLQANQAEKSALLVAALAKGLEDVEKAARERNDAESARHEAMARSFCETLQILQEKATDAQLQMVIAAQSAGAALSHEMRNALGQFETVCGTQLDAATAVRQTMEDQARKVTDHLDNLVERQTSHAAATLNALGKEARVMQGELATVLQQLHSLTVAQFSEFHRAQTQKQIQTSEGVGKHLEKLASRMSAGQEHQLKRMSAVATAIVKQGEVVQQGTKATRAEHHALVAQVTALCTTIAEDLQRSAKKAENAAEEHVKRIEVACEAGKDIVATAEPIHQTLTTLAKQVRRLNVVLNELSKKVGITWPQDPSHNGRMRWLRTIWK